MNTMAAIYFDDLNKLEYIREGNRLPNYDSFIKDVMNEHSVNVLFELWKDERKEHATRSTFDHELGTILLNAKNYVTASRAGSMFGMCYGNLAAVTYTNNTKPNLLEFCVVKTLTLQYYETKTN